MTRAEVRDAIHRHWPTLVWKVGLVLGFLSIFILWAIPRGGVVFFFPSMTFVPSTSLAYFIELPFITLPQSLPAFLHPDAWALAFGAAWLFLAGLLAQLFTRWGIVAQAVAIPLFVPLITSPLLTVGPGFILGCISIGMVSLGYYVEKKRGAP